MEICTFHFSEGLARPRLSNQMARTLKRHLNISVGQNQLDSLQNINIPSHLIQAPFSLNEVES